MGFRPVSNILSIIRAKDDVNALVFKIEVAEQIQHSLIELQSNNDKVVAPVYETHSTPLQPDDRKHLREILRAKERRLEVLELQQAQHGTQTPPHIVTEVADLRKEIAQLVAQLDAATPALNRAEQRQARADAFKAFLRKDWQQTEDLAAQVVEANTSDHEARGWLEAARKALGAAALYNTLRELKDEGNYEAVLEGMEAFEREYPKAKDGEKLKEWAETQQRYINVYSEVRQARLEGRWQDIIDLLTTLRSTVPTLEDPDLLWQWAKVQEQAQHMYASAVVARQSNDWQAVLSLVAGLEKIDTSFGDTEELRAWAKRKQRRKELYGTAKLALLSILDEFPEEKVIHKIYDQLSEVEDKPTTNLQVPDVVNIDSREADYRVFYKNKYAGTDIGYTSYGPTFRYGHNCATNDQYRDKDWNTIEPDIRARWEEVNPGTWPTFKDAIHYAWDRARSNL